MAVDAAHTESAAARAELDRLGGAVDCWRSGVYWYHDRDAAIAAAKASDKLVLSLRVLGRFDERLC